MKKCSKCGIEKHESEFNKGKGNKDGLNVWCRDCCKKERKLWNTNNPGKNASSTRKWKKENPERIIHYNNYSKKRKKEISLRNGRYYLKNRDKLIDRSRLYKIKNKKIISKKKYLRKLKDPLYKLRQDISSLIATSILNNNYKKNSKTAELLGCTFQQLMDHLGGPRPEGYQLDHICPNAQAKTEEETFKLQHYTNFQWLSKDDNLAKRHHITPEGEEMCRKLLGREWIHKT